MKRLGNIYAQIISRENCKAAIQNAAHDKRGRPEVQKVLNRLDAYADALHAMLVGKTYKPSIYRTIKVRDGPSKKERAVQVPRYWPDQCVHHALMNVLEQPFLQRMYYWSCGSLPGRGIRRAKQGVERATLHDQRKAKYAAKLDIKKCYASIPNDRLKAAFRRIIKDADALWIIDAIIDSCEGLPIGNYTSAWFANLYLTPLDWYIKQELGVEHYVRYMDDMVLMGPNKRKLHKAIRAVQTYTREKLGLELHDNWNVFRVRREGDGNKNRPIDFVSYCFCLGYTTLRKRNALAIMRQSRRIQKVLERGGRITYKTAAGFTSRAGQVKHCNADGLKRKYIDVVPMKLLKGVIRNESKRKHGADERIQH